MFGLCAIRVYLHPPQPLPKLAPVVKSLGVKAVGHTVCNSSWRATDGPVDGI